MRSQAHPWERCSSGHLARHDLSVPRPNEEKILCARPASGLDERGAQVIVWLVWPGPAQSPGTTPQELAADATLRVLRSGVVELVLSLLISRFPPFGR